MGGNKENDMKKRRQPAEKMKVLRELDQIKAFTNPLRVRILGALIEERTTKQVAQLIGESPTKLYHHVETLENAELIELTRTRQNRGTLEKYYLAVANSFRADPAIFSTEGPTSDELAPLRSMVTTILDSTAAELMDCISQENALESIQADGLLASVEVRVEPETAVELRQRLQNIIDWLVSLNDCETDPEDPSLERFRLSIAYFPLKPVRKDKDSS